MQKDQIRFLVEQYMKGELTASQQSELLALSEKGKPADSGDEGLAHVIAELMESDFIGAATTRPDTSEDDMARQRILQKVLGMDQPGVDGSWSENMTPSGKKGRIVWYVLAVAASVLALIFMGYYFIRLPQKGINLAVTQSKTNDVAPGTNKAVLTLGNGAKIILESARNGVLAQQGNTHVVKTDSGKLAYNESKDQPAVISYNTLTTPRGGDFQLTLSDGTKVWLNAASSITFPTAFTGTVRNVKVTGEAYFEVAKDKAKPFTVNAGEMEVTVLGTHFNINAYPDETAVKTTLLEGSVKVSQVKTNQSQMVLPGEQSQLTGDKLALIRQVNVDEIIAWKQGSFDFESADLKTILRQFARWYDVEVLYEGPVSSKRFFAVVSRNTSLKKVLELLQDNNVKFEIVGKKLMIKSN